MSIDKVNEELLQEVSTPDLEDDQSRVKITISNYQMFAGRTECDQSKSTINLAGDKDFRGVRLVHSLCGMVSDFAELAEPETRQNFKEEIGDMFWYLAQAANAMGWRLQDRVVTPSYVVSYTESMTFISNGISMFAEWIEHVYYYNKLVGFDSLNKALMDIYSGLAGLCRLAGFEVEDVLQVNIQKLRVRFPGKFNYKSVLEEHRDRSGERQAMEGSEYCD